MKKTMEVPDNVLTAIMHVVAWARGYEDVVDDVITYDVPVFENWLTELELLAPKPPLPTEIPDDVLQAIKAVVEHNYYDTSGSDVAILTNDMPVVFDWLVRLGVLVPPPALETQEEA
jgi:hypothetical protein